MPQAYVCINTYTGYEAEVLKKLKKVKEIEEAFLVYGVYDLIVKIKADSMEELRDNITLGLRKNKKIKSTLTMIIIE